jgi:subtilisin
VRTKIIISLIIALLLGFTAFFVQPAFAQTMPSGDPNIVYAWSGQAPPPDPIPGSYIVTFNNETVTSTAKTLREVNQDKKLFDLDVINVYTKAIKGYAVENLTGPGAAGVLLNIKRSDRDVQTIEQNLKTQSSAQFLPTGINRADADVNTATAYRIDNKEQKPDIDIAVIDTGVSNHPDLNVVSRVIAADIYEEGTPLKDVQGHGTHVAGTIAARDNLGGVVGMIPGARIWSVQVFGPNGGGSVAGMIAGMDYVTANAATIEIANLSGGLWTFSNSAVALAATNIVNAGVVFVVSAGNDATNVEWGPKSGNTFRVSLPCVATGVICVGAISDYDGFCGGRISNSQFSSAVPAVVKQKDADDRDAWYSNWSTNGKVDLYAPGSAILSTTDLQIPMGLIPKDFNLNPFQYKYNWGTSMASPHVAGAAAIVQLNNPSWTPAQIETDLKAKAYSRSSNPCSTSPTDSTGGVTVIGWLTLQPEQTPPSECVQNFVPSFSLPANWCGVYVDTAKMLDVSAYP